VARATAQRQTDVPRRLLKMFNADKRAAMDLNCQKTHHPSWRNRPALFRRTCHSQSALHLPRFHRARSNARACIEGPFGEVLRATGPMATANPFRFSTKFQDDATGLVYYGYWYRCYSILRVLEPIPFRQPESARQRSGQREREGRNPKGGEPFGAGLGRAAPALGFYRR